MVKSNSMKCFLAFALYFFPFILYSQAISQKLQKALQQFENDSQLKHAISSLYVIDAATGQVVFDKNSQVGLAPASTQKIITAATAFELLGKDYRYKTVFTSEHGEVTGAKLVIFGSGDPTFGSWRFNSTIDSLILNNLFNGVKKMNYSSFDDVAWYNSGDSKYIPSGWIFEDIGNYYGAASYDLNWHENQYDIHFIPGKKVGDAAQLSNYTELLKRWKYVRNECKTGIIGSGDNAYVYLNPTKKEILIQGTIPMGVAKFTISGADINPTASFPFLCIEYLKSKGIDFVKEVAEHHEYNKEWNNMIKSHSFYTHYSPSLDSIIYWFLKKSINLYGEALIKTFAYEKQGFGSTDSGVANVKKFWKAKGLDEDELNIYDGSGLSPLNRITTHAQVEILKYAKTKNWFPYFYDALPEYNGMKMKSGTISDVKGFCGYQKSKKGKEYIFSFLVNNYSGKTSGVVSKMYRVLDELK